MYTLWVVHEEPLKSSQSYSGAQRCFISVVFLGGIVLQVLFHTAELQWCAAVLHQCRLPRWHLSSRYCSTMVRCMPVMPGSICSDSQVGMVCARRGAATPARHPLPTFMVAPRLAPYGGVSQSSSCAWYEWFWRILWRYDSLADTHSSWWW